MKTISTKEVKLLMRRANNGKTVDFSQYWGEEFILTDPEQGIAYLLNQWKTPAGKERKNNPFGYRERHILENFSHFEFMGQYNAGSAHRGYYIPLWRVVAIAGGTFE